jgi:hypothetical protein
MAPDIATVPNIHRSAELASIPVRPRMKPEAYEMNMDVQ